MTSATTPHQKPFVSRLLIDLTVMIVIGVVLALIGPFGSFNDPLPLRLVVWVGFALIGYALYSPIDVVAQRLAPKLDLPTWGLRLAGVMISSVPMAVIVWLLPRDREYWIWPGLEAALTHYVYVAIIGGLITLVNIMFQRGQLAKAAPPHEASAEPAPIVAPAAGAPAGTSFLDRLPPELGSELIALEMEDHYVRAHTALGNELVLLRMRDAVTELDGIDGKQIHRSWWVARGAVADVKREGRNVRLVLDNGLEAPVSRANVTPLKEAGWI